MPAAEQSAQNKVKSSLEEKKKCHKIPICLFILTVFQHERENGKGCQMLVETSSFRFLYHVCRVPILWPKSDNFITPSIYLCRVAVAGLATSGLS